MLRISAFTHSSFSGLQERFLGNAFNDDTRISLMSPANQSLVPAHIICFIILDSYIFLQRNAGRFISFMRKQKSESPVAGRKEIQGTFSHIAAFATPGRLCIGDSGIQPPPLRGTSFHRKEVVSTRASSLGRGEGRSEAGLAFFLRRSRHLFAFPLGEGGPRQRWIGYSRKRLT